MADAIFISYRRDDSEGEAGRLFDDLARAFGNDAVFMDVAGIKPGVDFREAIEDNVTHCGVLLAIVGPTWATIASPDGKRRLEDPNDFVALEISSALRRKVPVIPVLVHDAKMPTADLLPESLKSFSYRNSVELSHARWNSDVQLLIEALKPYVQPSALTASEPVHATVPVQLPAPHPTTGSLEPRAASGSKGLLKAGIGAAALVAIAMGVFFAMRKSGTTPSPPPGPAPGPNPSGQVLPVPSPNNGSGNNNYATSGSAGLAAEFVGTWKRTGGAGDNDALGMLVISSANGLTIHAYGRCQAPVCDWGQQPGTIQGADVAATFSPAPNGSDSSRTAQVIAHPVDGGLDVTVKNTFQNPAGARRSSSHHLFSNAR